MSGLRNNNGFTLVEIMIAIFILVIALLGLISVTVMVIKGNSFSKTMTTATTLAKDEMEQLKNLKNLSYNDPSLIGDTSSAGLQHDDAGNPLETIYTRQWWVRNDYPATDMKTITLRVSWSWQGASRQVELKTIMAK